jgi:hypothetical protein
MQKRYTKWFGAVIGAMLVGSAAQGALVIDTFDQTSRPEPLPAAPGPEGGNINGFAELGLAGVPGGSRAVSVQATVIDVPGLDNVVAQLFPGAGGFLDYNSSAGADGLLRLTYNGNQGGANLDLTGLPFLEVSLAAVEVPTGEPMAVRLELRNDVPDRGQPTPPPDLTRDILVTSSGPQTLRFDLSALADPSDVDVLMLTFDPGRGGDFRIDSITAQIPEPAALGVLAAALVSGLLRRRRRRGH